MLFNYRKEVEEIGRRHKHEGVYSIDFYAYQSRLRGLNPTFKCLTAMVTLLLCILCDHFFVSLFVVVTMSFITVNVGGLSLKRYLSLLTIPLLFLAMGSIAIAVGFSQKPYGDVWINLHWFYAYVTWDETRMALNLTVKALGAVSAMYMMVLSTPASEIITVIRNLRVPKVVIELMNMIYRFIFVLIDTQGKMHEAAQSRLGYCDFKTSCRSFGSTAGNLLIVALKKADIYYDALISRCYDGDLLFLEEEKPVKIWQIIMVSGYFLLLIAVWTLT